MIFRYCLVLALTTVFLIPFKAFSEQEKMLIIWVTPKDKKGSALGSYKHIVSKTMWSLYGKEELQTILQKKFGTTKYGHTKINPGNCYTRYTKTKNNGNIKNYTTIKSNHSAAQEYANQLRNQGTQVIEVGCNNLAGDFTPKPVRGTHKEFLDNFATRSVQPGLYKCPSTDNGQFEVRPLKDGAYLIIKDNKMHKVSINRLLKSTNDKKWKRNVKILENKMYSAMHSACNLEENAQSWFIPWLKSMLKAKAEECIHEKGKTHPDCQTIKRRAAPTGILG